MQLVRYTQVQPNHIFHSISYSNRAVGWNPSVIMERWNYFIMTWLQANNLYCKIYCSSWFSSELGYSRHSFSWRFSDVPKDLGMKKMVDKKRRRSKRSKIIKHGFESCSIRIFHYLFANWFQLKCVLFIFLHVSLAQSQPLKTTRITRSIPGISKFYGINILWLKVFAY